MPIYTRTGDTGTTALFGGKRVLKCEELIDVYGSIDELNSWMGLVNSKLKTQNSKLLLETIQKDLFTIGSFLAGWKRDLKEIENRVGEMEKAIDEMEKGLPPLRNFILPGGSTAASWVHLARAVCRRVERQAVKLSQTQKVDLFILQYLNRFSDLLFVLARYINKQENVPEIIWKLDPGF